LLQLRPLSASWYAGKADLLIAPSVHAQSHMSPTSTATQSVSAAQRWSKSLASMTWLQPAADAASSDDTPMSVESKVRITG
jgi:hypothetical protein